MHDFRTQIKPEDLQLFLTRKCNLRCPGCLWIMQDEHFFSDYEMSVKDALKIVEYFHTLGLQTIAPQAEGEVLLYRD